MNDIKLAKHASEGGSHFYDRQGNQIATVKSADGKKDIKPDIRHARKLDLAPGLTTILRCAHKEPLVLWMKEQVALAACRLPRLDTESDADYVHRLMEASNEIRDAAADRGTLIHAAIQEHFHGRSVAEDLQDNVNNALDTLDTACGTRDWMSEQPAVSPYGYATKIDLVCDDWLLDIKSKSATLAELQALKTYPDHWRQLAAGLSAYEQFTGYAQTRDDLIALRDSGRLTAEQLPPDVPGAWQRRLGILFVSRTEVASHLVEVTPEQAAKGLATFKALLEFHQQESGHRPSWSLPVYP